MSFSFSFSGDDIEDDTPFPSHQHQPNNASPPEDTLTQKLQNATLTSTLIPPRHHTLSDLLNSLPSQISYNYLDIPLQPLQETNSAASTHDNDVYDDNGIFPSNIRIPRRSLFDIRHQLMAESDPSNTDDEAVSLLSGLETGDLRSGIYEGGFKTWECAVDLGGFMGRIVNGYGDGEGEGKGGLRVIEVGAGSAVPSLVVLEGVLRGRRERKGVNLGKVKFTLCDYNEDVLRLGTAVNVFLVVVSCLGLVNREHADEADEEEGEIEVDEDLVQKVQKTLDDLNIEVDFVSGAWGADFVWLTKTQDNENPTDTDSKLLLLASETIYSPDSLHVFSETVLEILRSTRGEKNAYVAAKKVYFGVGGGVREFEGEVRRLSGRTEMVFDVKGSGVGRVVLEVFGG